MSQDIQDYIEQDKQTLLSGNWRGGFSTEPAALVEGVLGALAALAGVLWFVALLWVPDTIPSGVWMGAGLLSLGVFGAPAALVYWLRRGGARVVEQLIHQNGG